VKIYTIGVVLDPRDGSFWAIIETETNWTSGFMHKIEVVYRHKLRATVQAKLDREYAPAIVCAGCAHDDTCQGEMEELTDEGLCRNRKEPEVSRG
jgi:hypothetical protein